MLDLGSGGGFDVFQAGEKVKTSGRVIGVDMTPEMLGKARKNIGHYRQHTGLDNVEFFVGKAEEVLPEQYEKNKVYADVIVVDPPRKGCDEQCLNTIVTMAPKRVVYVS